MVKLLNQFQQRVLDVLNRVERPNFVGTSDDSGLRPHLWIAQSEYDDQAIVASLFGRSVRFVLTPDCAVKLSTVYGSLSRDDLFEVNAYMRACEDALALDDGLVAVQARDVDAALQGASPDFRKTDAFRRLDDALG